MNIFMPVHYFLISFPPPFLHYFKNSAQFLFPGFGSNFFFFLLQVKIFFCFVASSRYCITLFIKRKYCTHAQFWFWVLSQKISVFKSKSWYFLLVPTENTIIRIWTTKSLPNQFTCFRILSKFFFLFKLLCTSWYISFI